ncbi:MAG: NCS2 family permease [Eubacteriales bacterium]|nr:NCS2 family permease [Clostridia bacterium]
MVFEKLFKLKENKTNVRTELLAGIVTFMTMAYILIVNPNILSEAGMDWGAVFTATALAAAIACIAMAFFANYPVALASGMGLNAFFAGMAIKHGSWQIMLTAIFLEGIIFILLSLVNFREKIVESIPDNLKHAVTVGIGLFIAFIGFKNAGVITPNEGTMIGLGDMKSLTVILSLVGLLLTIFMVHKGIKGALLWGILGTYAIGIVLQLTGVYVVDPAAGMYDLIPDGVVSLPPSLKSTFLKFDFKGAIELGFEFIVILFAFLFVDIFDTIGTLIGVATKADMLDENGKLPRVKGALLADAVGTVAGSGLGTSTVTSYIESASGVAAGGRTGLTALTTGLLFIVALVFSPIFMAIPSFATAPILVIVGLFMMTSVTKIDFEDYTEAMPAFLTLIIMPLAGSIADGIVFGMLSWFLLKLFSGKVKKIPVTMYVLVVIFCVYLFV